MENKNKMYLVTQGQGEYEDYREYHLLATDSYDEAIEYMKKRNKETMAEYIDYPMTIEDFERKYNMGLPDGMTEYDVEEGMDEDDYDFDAAYARNVIDRDGHTKEEFIEMNHIVNEISLEDWGFCMLYEFKPGEPESFEYISVDVMKE